MQFVSKFFVLQQLTDFQTRITLTSITLLDNGLYILDQVCFIVKINEMLLLLVTSIHSTLGLGIEDFCTPKYKVFYTLFHG